MPNYTTEKNLYLPTNTSDPFGSVFLPGLADNFTILEQLIKRLEEQNLHVDSRLNGTQALTKGTNTELTSLSNVVSRFPSDIADGHQIKIPRSGFYMFALVIRATAVTSAQSVMRMSVNSGSGNVILGDFLISSAYETAFYSGSFMKDFKEGDIISPCLNPLNENITIQAGTRLTVFFLGDSPSI